MNLREENTLMPRITKCLVCGKVCLGEQHLMRHQIESHSIEEEIREVRDPVEVREDEEIEDEEVREDEEIEDEPEEARNAEEASVRVGRWKQFRRDLIQ